MKSVFGAACLLSLAALSAHAEAPRDKPLPGERVGGEGQDVRVGTRIDNRLPTRLDTRVTRRTIDAPLLAANSRVVADANNGCARDPNASAPQICQRPK
jgi:hypothetical protein